MRRLVTMVGIAACLLVPASAAAVTQTASSGSVSASFSYSFSGGGSGSGLPAYTQLHLTISRAGKVVYDQGVKGCRDCQPGAYPAGKPSVQVLDLAGSREPNVVLSLFTGGANCCFVAEVFSYAPAAATYAMSEHNFLNPGYRLERLGPGAPLRFVSADARFVGFLTSDAASGVPVQIVGFAAGRFTDVTGRYPALIAKDAAFWWRTFRHDVKQGGTGALAAWAADEERLHHDGLVQRTLLQQLAAHHLTGGFVNGRAYITALNRLLRSYGYRRR